jgi:hypothetical protein
MTLSSKGKPFQHLIPGPGLGRRKSFLNSPFSAPRPNDFPAPRKVIFPSSGYHWVMPVHHKSKGAKAGSGNLFCLSLHYGAPGQTRTGDTGIRNPLLYPLLSYGGAKKPGGTGFVSVPILPYSSLPELFLTRGPGPWPAVGQSPAEAPEMGRTSPVFYHMPSSPWAQGLTAGFIARVCETDPKEENCQARPG